MFRVGAIGCLALAAVTACGTMTESSPSSLSEFYACGQQLTGSDGTFEIEKALTLEGAPYTARLYAGVSFAASWNSFSLRRQQDNVGTAYNDYTVGGTGQDAIVTVHLYWMQPLPKRYRILLSRKDDKAQSHYGNLGMQTDLMTSHSPPRGSAFVHQGRAVFSSRLTHLLAFAGTEHTLVATVFDENYVAGQSLLLDMQELRDGVAKLGKLVSEFEARTRDYTRACQLEADGIITVADAD